MPDEPANIAVADTGADLEHTRAQMLQTRRELLHSIALSRETIADSRAVMAEADRLLNGRPGVYSRRALGVARHRGAGRIDQAMSFAFAAGRSGPQARSRDALPTVPGREVAGDPVTCVASSCARRSAFSAIRS